MYGNFHIYSTMFYTSYVFLPLCTRILCKNLHAFHKTVKTVKLFSLETFHVYGNVGHKTYYKYNIIIDVYFVFYITPLILASFLNKLRGACSLYIDLWLMVLTALQRAMMLFFSCNYRNL